MAGYLFITEYSNMGDVAAETPLEPMTRRQKIAVAGQPTEELHADTRCVVLFATFPCLVSFSAGDHDADRAWPMAEGVEVVRKVNPNTSMTIKAFDEEVML